MTLEEFYTEFNKIRDQFTVTSNGTIRSATLPNGLGSHCPITGVCHELTKRHFDALHWYTAARTLGMDRPTATSIMRASDRLWPRHSIEHGVRLRLVEILTQ